MITRSVGIPPRVAGLPWGGPLPGGGYEGKTKRLDRAVQRFAKWLHDRIPGPVQIRFNSDRQSGGAYVYPGSDHDAPVTFDTPEIGLGARLTMPPALAQKHDRLIKRRAWGEADQLFRQWEREQSEETPLRYRLLVYPQFLRDPSDMGDYKPGDRFGYWTVATPQEAYRLFKRLVTLPAGSLT